LAWEQPYPVTNEVGRYSVKGGASLPNSVTEDIGAFSLAPLYSSKQLRRINQLKILSITEPRTVNLKTGSTARVADAIISDETGSIKLSLWDNQINSICDGDNISIEKGYTKEYRREIILCVSKDGTLTKH
jgi:replication factor A1